MEATARSIRGSGDKTVRVARLKVSTFRVVCTKNVS
jgi:hypothetical protein